MATNPSWCLTGLSPESKRRDFKRLHTQKSNISRLENVNSKISPKLSTIEEYAKAVGFKLELDFVPQNTSKPQNNGVNDGKQLGVF